VFLRNKQFKNQKKARFIREKTITTNYETAARLTNKHYWDIIHMHVVHINFHTDQTLCMCNMFAFKTLPFLTLNNCGTNMQTN